jgi:hypothetical protein
MLSMYMLHCIIAENPFPDEKQAMLCTLLVPGSTQQAHRTPRIYGKSTARPRLATHHI